MTFKERLQSQGAGLLAFAIGVVKTAAFKDDS